MNKERIVELIKELAKMSGEKGNKDTKDEEIKTVVPQIKELEKQIDDINASVSNTSDYFRLEDKLRLQQLEHQYKRNLNDIIKRIDGIKAELEKAKAKEASLSNDLKSIFMSISSELKAKAGQKAMEKSSAEARENYQSAVELAQKDLDEDNERKNKLEKKYELVQNEILKLSAQIEELEVSKSFYENSLDKMQKDLSSDENFIDKEKRQADIDKLTELNKKYEELNKNHIDIVNSSIMLESKAKEALVDGDVLTAFNKVKALADKVAEMPYMNVPNDENLAKKEEEIKEYIKNFVNEHKKKKTNNDQAEIIDSRISFLNNSITTWEEEINAKNADIAQIDTGKKYPISEDIKIIKEKIVELKEEINQYKEKINTYEGNLSKKVEFQAGLNKKEEQLRLFREILDDYKLTQISSIDEVDALQANIESIEAKIVKAKEEINKLQNIKLKADTKEFDILEEEMYQEKLAELNNDFMALKHRRNFARTVDEILEEVKKELGLDLTTIEEMTSVELDNIETQELSNDEQVLSEDSVAELKDDEPILTENNTQELSLSDILDKNKEKEQSVEYKPAFSEEVEEEPVIEATIPEEIVEEPVADIDLLENKINELSAELASDSASVVKEPIISTDNNLSDLFAAPAEVKPEAIANQSAIKEEIVEVAEDTMTSEAQKVVNSEDVTVTNETPVVEEVKAEKPEHTGDTAAFEELFSRVMEMNNQVSELVEEEPTLAKGVA